MPRIKRKEEDTHMAQRSDKLVTPVEPVHARTGAKKANTPEAATPRPAPSVQQVLAAQQQPPPKRQAAASTALTPVTAPTPPTARSHEAFLKNAGEMGGGIPTILHHGTNNVYMCDGSEMPDGTTLIVHYPEAQHGYRQWHGPGVQPTVILRPLADERGMLTRDDLEDGHGEVPGLDGTPRPKWEEEYVLPMVSTDDAGEVFLFSARNATSRTAVKNLLYKVSRHPKGRRGLLPIVRLDTTTFWNKKFNREQPKPDLKIVGWVDGDGDRSRDGNALVPKAGTTDAFFNDSIEFLVLKIKRRTVGCCPALFFHQRRRCTEFGYVRASYNTRCDPCRRSVIAPRKMPRPSIAWPRGATATTRCRSRPAPSGRPWTNGRNYATSPRAR
jgi:hypothetical protein